MTFFSFIFPFGCSGQTKQGILSVADFVSFILPCSIPGPRMQAYDEAKLRGDPQPGKVIKNMPGYYRCCVYKWKKVRVKDEWALVCRACPRIASANKELPDVLRRFMGRTTKYKSRRPNAVPTESSYTNLLPAEFEAVLSDAIAAWLIRWGATVCFACL